MTSFAKCATPLRQTRLSNRTWQFTHINQLHQPLKHSSGISAMIFVLRDRVDPIPQWACRNAYLCGCKVNFQTLHGGQFGYLGSTTGPPPKLELVNMLLRASPHPRSTRVEAGSELSFLLSGRAHAVWMLIRSTFTTMCRTLFCWANVSDALGRINCGSV